MIYMKNIYKRFVVAFLFSGFGICLSLNASMMDQLAPYVVKNSLLLRIVSEPQNNLIHEVYVHLDDNGDVLGATREGGGDKTSFTIDELNAGKVLLAESQGYKAVFITCKTGKCTPKDGGLLDLEYLKNALFNIYDHFEIDLRRIKGKDGQDEWVAYSNTGVYLKSIKLVKGMVGIKKIEMNPAR